MEETTLSGYQQNPYSGPQPPPAPQGHGYPVAPPVQPYGPPGGHPGYAMPVQPRNGLGTAAMVCGIVGAGCGLSFVLWFSPSSSASWRSSSAVSVDPG